MYHDDLRRALLSAKWSFSSVQMQSLARLLAHRCAPQLQALQVDRVIPIPQHWRQRLLRHFNPAWLVAEQLAKRGITTDARLPALCALYKDRCDTTVALADWAQAHYTEVNPKAEDLAQHVTEAVKPAIASLAQRLQACAWDKASIAAALKETLAEHGLKMPQLAMPVRVLVMGTPNTPSLDAVLEQHDREKICARLQKA